MTSSILLASSYRVLLPFERNELRMALNKTTSPAEKLARSERSRLAEECAKLDPAFEKSLAEEGISEDLNEWPEY